MPRREGSMILLWGIGQVTSYAGLGDGPATAFTAINPDGCNWAFPVLFFSYCTVDFCTYAMGLYVIQRGGANLMILASAISLPLTQLVLCVGERTTAFPCSSAAITPKTDAFACGAAAGFVMGPFSQTFAWTDAAALALCLGGFGIYQKCSREGIASRRRDCHSAAAPSPLPLVGVWRGGVGKMIVSPTG